MSFLNASTSRSMAMDIDSQSANANSSSGSGGPDPGDPGGHHAMELDPPTGGQACRDRRPPHIIPRRRHRVHRLVAEGAVRENPDRVQLERPFMPSGNQWYGDHSMPVPYATTTRAAAPNTGKLTCRSKAGVGKPAAFGAVTTSRAGNYVLGRRARAARRISTSNVWTQPFHQWPKWKDGTR